MQLKAVPFGENVFRVTAVHEDGSLLNQRFELNGRVCEERRGSWRLQLTAEQYCTIDAKSTFIDTFMHTF
jgi:hypothetical protein